MSYLDSSQTLWLSVPELARIYLKQRNTVYYWAESGFLLELGFIVRRDPTNHIRVGVPKTHKSHTEILGSLSEVQYITR